MKLIKIIILCFFSLFLSIFGKVNPGLAVEPPDIKIIEPKDGTTVIPGQEITVTVESMGGFVIKEGVAGVDKFSLEPFTSLPARFTITIPKESIGKVTLAAFAYGESVPLVTDKITLNVQQTATLQSLEINQDEIFVDLDWDGNIKGKSSDNFVTIYGIYSDGVKRILDDDPGTSYASSDPLVISVDNKGNWQLHKVAPATITISNSGLSKVIPVVYLKPRGIKPSETIPPTTQIDIQPTANSAGWHNQDITITLTAQDNEGGSGIQEVDWRFAGKAREDYVKGDSAVVAYGLEGAKFFNYWSRDKEGNEDDNKIEIHLDKTPPTITAQVQPLPDSSGWNNTDVTVTFNAADKLSGIKSVTPPITVTSEGAKQNISGEAIDVADNKASASVALNIDKTPPKLSITATPNILWPPNNKMVDVTINGQAIDNISGIDNLTFKVIDEYGKYQPVITGFGSVIKLEASRDGNDKNGRTYTILATAKDKAGNESQASTIVTVPHDMGKTGKK